MEALERYLDQLHRLLRSYADLPAKIAHFIHLNRPQRAPGATNQP